MLWDVPALPHVFVTRCVSAITARVILCSHVHDVVVESLPLPPSCSAHFAHHNAFDLSLKQLNVFFESRWLPSVIAKVVELVHRVDTLESYLVCRLSARPASVSLPRNICVELSCSSCSSQLACEAH